MSVSSSDPLNRDLLYVIEASRDDMPEALGRIADFILREPEVALRASMSSLADLSGSGEASIVRFCRRLGFDGFHTFKLSLASDIAYRSSATPRDGDLGTRISNAVRSTIDGTEADDIRIVAEKLSKARTIDIFGAGVSGMVAQLFAYRFSRVGLVARAITDPVVAEEIMGGIDARSVYMTVSETGLTTQTEKLLEMAGKRGAYRVAISGRRIADLHQLCETLLIATPLSPLPERGEIAPAVAKIVLCEMLTDQIRKRN